MRGKATFDIEAANKLRITPAHAGKRESIAFCDSVVKDHPRACGEKESWQVTAEYAPGSPPRMRGKAERQSLSVMLKRITPAHAGKRERTTSVGGL